MAGTEKVNLESYDSYNNEQFIPLLQCLQVTFSIYQDLRKGGGAGGVRGVGGSYKIVRTIYVFINTKVLVRRFLIQHQHDHSSPESRNMIKRMEQNILLNIK